MIVEYKFLEYIGWNVSCRLTTALFAKCFHPSKADSWLIRGFEANEASEEVWTVEDEELTANDLSWIKYSHMWSQKQDNDCLPEPDRKYNREFRKHKTGKFNLQKRIVNHHCSPPATVFGGRRLGSEPEWPAALSLRLCNKKSRSV